MQCWFALLLAPCLVGWLPVHAGSQESPTLRPPWTARSSPFVGDSGLRARSERPAGETRALVDLVERTRAVLETLLAVETTRALDRPLLLVFDDPRELDLVVRTEFIVTELRKRGTACSFVADEGQVIALALGGSDPLTIQQDLKSSVLDQYLLPRFGTLVPPWLQEGLAQYVGALHLVDGTLVQGEPPVGFPTLLREALETDELLDFDVLFELDAESWERRKRAGEAGLMEAQSWAVVHYLMHGGDPEGPRWLRSAIRELADRDVVPGRPPIRGAPDPDSDDPFLRHLANLENGPVTGLRRLALCIRPVLAHAEIESNRIEDGTVLRAACARWADDPARDVDPFCARLLAGLPTTLEVGFKPARNPPSPRELRELGVPAPPAALHLEQPGSGSVTIEWVIERDPRTGRASWQPRVRW
ncbi:MAG: hypothetical protein VXX86_09380 [Planctomycetota bacterium]|nr:hypothetical protein [Planctomycetota bacterium]